MEPFLIMSGQISINMIKVNKNRSSKNRNGVKKLRYIYNNGLKNEDGHYFESNKNEVLYDEFFIKIYPSTVGVLLSLGGCPVYLFLYLTTIAGDDNWVATGSGIRKRFNDWVKILTDGNKNYGDSTIKNALGQLRDAKLLVSDNFEENKRGSAVLNPLHFWKGKEAARIKAIQRMLEAGIDARNYKLEKAFDEFDLLEI